MYPSTVSSWRLRWPLLVCLLVVLATGVAILIASDLRTPQGASGRAAFARALQRPALPMPRLPATDGSVLAARAAAGVTVKAAQPGPGEAEVCGIGIVKVSARDPDGLTHIPEQARSRTWDHLRAVFAASPAERTRALGLMLEARLQSGRATAARDALAQVAAASSDALVYALAIEACRSLDAKQAAAGACQLINAEQWARLDAQNAVPWLSLAWMARQRGDAAGVAEAVYRASLARVSDAHAFVVPTTVSQALPADLPPLGRTIALVDAWRVQAAFHLPSHHAAIAYCAEGAVADSNLRQVCDQLAKLLLEQGRAAPDPLAGRTIGERVGWPLEQVQALRDEQNMLLHTAAERARGSTVLSCENVTRMTEWAAQAAEMGEFGALRDLLRRSGKSIDQAIAEYRLRVPAVAEPVVAVPSAVTNEASGVASIATAQAGEAGGEADATAVR